MEMLEALYRKYPDIQVTIEDMIAEGDKVVCRNIWRGKDAQTGKAMEFHGFVLWRMQDGKIAERWATVTAPTEIVL
jgi:predicted ester cyclase